MKQHHRLSKKLWMSLIELLVVITIIWILIWVLVPTIWNTQWRTRDITRQSQVQELAAALMSYKLDYWEFPVILWSFQSWWISTETPYRWNISLLNFDLKEWWYMTKIQKDPSGLSFSYSENYGDKSYDSIWYYLYLSNGKSFAIITLVEDEKNGNCDVQEEVLFDKLLNIKNEDDYFQFFDWTNNSQDSWPIYMYKYKDEVL